MLHILFLSCMAVGCSGTAAKPLNPPEPDAACVGVGQWVDPTHARVVTPPEIQARLAASRVVLLGEAHDRADHHVWQLQMAAALLAEGRSLALAFEMLPRSGQTAANRWSRGEGDEATFLADSGFLSAWGMPAELYLPLFRFARLNRLPLVALNVERDLVAKVGEVGWQAIPAGERAGLGDPAPPSPAYAAWLGEIYGDHQADNADPGKIEAVRRRFIEAQQVWDRAFAEGIAGALRQYPESTVVGIIGSGHLQHGYGVQHQLAALGITDVTTLLPWEVDNPCDELVPGLADAVFGTDARITQTNTRPRLGVMLAPDAAGVRIAGVAADSVAAATGLQLDDIILAAAGRTVRSAGDLQAIVARQAPGTWLPLRVRRGSQELDFVARFPSDD